MAQPRSISGAAAPVVFAEIELAAAEHHCCYYSIETDSEIVVDDYADAEEVE